MSDKMYLCDEYKLYFKIEDDVEVLHNEVELYNAQFVGNNAFCHEEYIDGQRALTYSIPAMTTMNQFLEKKIHKDELVDLIFSIADQLMYLKANDLSIGKVILNKGYMYIDFQNMAVQLIFLPIDKPMDRCNMEKFIRDLMGNMKFANKKASDAGYGYKFMGFFDDNLSLKKSLPNFQGDCSSVEDFVIENKVDEIYCALPMRQEEKITRLLKFSEASNISFYMVPDVGRYIHRQLEFQLVGNVPVLSLHPEPLQNIFSRFLKRVFDLLFSSIVLVCSPIIFTPIAIAVKLSSPGPVFFKQKRTGFKGKEFNCYKFRTMKVNANSDQLQASRHDPRKTRVGEFLRKTSLDELPQFINVFVGDMSVVGPRPHMVKHTQDYSKIIDKYMLRHLIKPGITGWAQVNGYRGETRELWQMERRVEYDVWYIEHWNFWLDIKIIFLTVVNAFRGEKNAF